MSWKYKIFFVQQIHFNRQGYLLPCKRKYRIAGNFADENFRDLKVKVCEINFVIFIFAISNEQTFELGDQIKR